MNVLQYKEKSKTKCKVKYNTNNSKIMNKSNNNYESRTVAEIEISFRVLINVIKVIKNKE